MNPYNAGHCACANVLCAQYGCQKLNYAEPRCQCGLYNHQTCSRQPCLRQQPTYTYPSPNYALLYSQLQTQRGCICPPGANKECENQYCPRKPVPSVSTLMETKK